MYACMYSDLKFLLLPSWIRKEAHWLAFCGREQIWNVFSICGSDSLWWDKLSNDFVNAPKEYLEVEKNLYFNLEWK